MRKVFTLEFASGNEEKSPSFPNYLRWKGDLRHFCYVGPDNSALGDSKLHDRVFLASICNDLYNNASAFGFGLFAMKK